MKKLFFTASMALLALPGMAFAAGIVPDNPFYGQLPGNSGTTATDLVTGVLEILLGIVGLIAVMFIIIGGFRYITSAGNDEQAAAGRKTMTNAIIGLVIVILSYVIIVAISNALVNGNI